VNLTTFERDERELLALALLHLVRSIPRERWVALTELLIEACHGDVTRARRLAVAAGEKLDATAAQ
jgi:hypothetical protein